MTSKTTKRALLTSIMAMLLSFSMLVGTTYAWFTDSETSANNTILAGNLDVGLEHATFNEDGSFKEWSTVESTTNLFGDDTKWEPGYTEVVYLKISNDGNLALKYLFNIRVLSEDEGINVAGERFKLSDYIQFGIVNDLVEGEFYGDRVAAISAITNPQPLSEAISDQHGYASFEGEILVGGAPTYVALVIWMPSTVGNEANHNGTYAPMIQLGVNLLATQYTAEADSFDSNYDKEAAFGGTTVSAPMPEEGSDKPVELQIRNAAGAKVASFLLPYASLDTTQETVSATVERKESEERYEFEINVVGLKENNNVPVKVQLRIPAGLDSTKIFLTHKGNPIQSFVYNPITGYVIFETTGFSPFAIDFDPDALVDYNAEAFPKDIPTAVVDDISDKYVGKIEWDAYGPFYELDNAQQLECAFAFKAPHDSTTVEECKYKDWACDYIVSIDRDIETDSIVLGGNYGGFGWVGFYNPVNIVANEQIPLLGSFLGGESDWTYEMVVDFVGEFLCGVAEANEPATDLDGATFTVRLRLTNPSNRDEICDVNVVKYTFADPKNNQAAKITIENFTADIIPDSAE